MDVSQGLIKRRKWLWFCFQLLYADVISPDQIQDGFFMLLESADDLAVDILDAVDILALFLVRAVVDDIIPPAFLNWAKKGLPESSKGVQAIQIADKSYLSAPHHAELVERKWGGSTHITVEEVKKKIADLLREHVESGDTIKAYSLDDLALDIPSAKTLFQSLVPKAISEGWLDSSFAKPSGEDWEVPDDAYVRRFKEESVTIIHEYFLSDDIPKLIQSLVDLGVPEYNPIFSKKLITLAMDRKNREKEMASVLLSSLHSEIFSCEDIANGFLLLLESAEDTALGILDASNELVLFLARAVIDDVLVPHNLEEMSCKLPPDSSGSETLRMARALLSARHAGERILMCWGGEIGGAVEDAKDNILKLLEEYESGGVVGEACQCIHNLGMPFFNPEVVKKALVMAMERKNDRILDLLQECFTEGLITINQMTKSFTWIKDGLDEQALDIPNAKEKFNFYVEHAQKKGWLLPSFGSSASDGAGGKGTRGKLLDTDGESHLDQNDPNHDSGENTRMEKPNLDEFYHVFTSCIVKIHQLLHDEGDGSMCEKLERIQDKLFREFCEEFCEGN
ncbi:hypothetical protein SO802_020222 [Lithocarpus litseifolius]|uniref:MI domain-containing protein n=1 Tax=Lithocarpus litseifolius TaxID=425828 RepID=A0AAW2CB55_9ROSI